MINHIELTMLTLTLFIIASIQLARLVTIYTIQDLRLATIYTIQNLLDFLSFNFLISAVNPFSDLIDTLINTFLTNTMHLSIFYTDLFFIVIETLEFYINLVNRACSASEKKKKITANQNRNINHVQRSCQTDNKITTGRKSQKNKKTKKQHKKTLKKYKSSGHRSTQNTIQPVKGGGTAIKLTRDCKELLRLFTKKVGIALHLCEHSQPLVMDWQNEGIKRKSSEFEAQISSNSSTNPKRKKIENS